MEGKYCFGTDGTDGDAVFYSGKSHEVCEDVVNNPKHYQLDCGVEVIDIIGSTLTPEAYMGYLKGNVIKYILRADKKNKRQDLEKAQWYLNRILDEE